MMLFSLGDTLEIAFNKIMKELDLGVSEPGHPFRLVTLSTVGNNQPDLRWVVLRGLERENRFYFYTDGRTKKVADLKKNPHMALLFYHPEKQVQVKVSGKALVHQQNETSERHWSNVKGEGKKAYNSMLNPGSPIVDPEEAFHWQVPMDDRHFCVIEVAANKIESLQLNGFNHIRMASEWEKQDWMHCWLAP
ncbi:MAG: pyridoxamine 5'-phosphate oxidase family protein [Cyclobacteriaceae bacterium]